MKKRFSEEQIIGFLREADAGVPVKRKLPHSADIAKVEPSGIVASLGGSVMTQ